MAWSPDGSNLIVGLANQQNIGTGFLNLADVRTAVVRAVSTSNGSISTIPGLPQPAFLPTYQSEGALPGSLSGVNVEIFTEGNNQLRFRATGVDPQRLYFLQSSSTLAPNSFSTPVPFTGAQLLNGIDLNPPTPIRYFRLVEP